MLAVLSPAKNLDFTTPPHIAAHTEPSMLAHAEALIQRCRELTPVELASLMKLSDKLAALNVARFAQWQPPFTLDNAKQAVLAFNGDVYAGLEASSLSEEQLDYAQQHLAILSGLYGVLQPLDLIQPYRLEMGTKLSNVRGRDLYAFWAEHITEALNSALAKQGDNVLINLASNEYFKAVNVKKLAAQVITPVFKDRKNGQYKIISFYAKKARGLMARYLIENQLSEPQQLTHFSADGYRFSAEQSNATTLVFLRDQPQ